MSAELAVGLAIGIPGFALPLVGVFRTLWSLAARHLAYPDLAIRVQNPGETHEPPQANIRLAYAGTSPLLIESLEVRADLRHLSRLQRVAGFFQLARGYLTYDVEGLETSLGMIPSRGKLQVNALPGPYWAKRTVSVLFGSFMLYILVSALLDPILWLMLFMFPGTSPFGRLQLVAPDDSIRLRDVTSEKELMTPFILQPNTQKEFCISYRVYLRASGFSPDTPVKYISHLPEYTLWKLPRRGQFVWRREDILRLRIRSRWRSYSLSLGRTYASIG